MTQSDVQIVEMTETTQRWKLEIRPRTRGSVPLHTKIEFSRRVTTEEAVIEAVSPTVTGAYQLLPLLVRHYPLGAALKQKVRALVGRTTVQARDVFDLAILLARSGGGAEELSQERAILPRAVERAMSVSYDDFRGQVVAFLHPDHASSYDSPEAWDALQIQVVELLAKASS